MVYRLADSRPERSFKLQGLDPGVWYRVTVDSKALPPVSAQQLSTEGLSVRLDAEYRAAVVELEREK
jgi:hypothetical protein